MICGLLDAVHLHLRAYNIHANFEIPTSSFETKLSFIYYTSTGREESLHSFDIHLFLQVLEGTSFSFFFSKKRGILKIKLPLFR